MPGIAGVISKQSTGNEARELNLMLHCMMHEPFYNSCTYINHQLGFYTGCVSIEGSFSECMPIYNEKRDLVLLFTGECFEEAKVVDHLRTLGHEFNPRDASYLIHLYEAEGEAFFKILNGWFSGIILDCQKQKAMLFNDRYGLQRIYYHEDDNSFFFSSEAKSLLKILPFLRAVDLDSLGEYFTFDCVLGNRTFFSNVFRLPGGSVWSFINGNVKKNRYFEPSSWENRSILEKDSFFEELIGTFKRILPLYLSGKSLGMSLTGGLDTRMILSCIDPGAGELPCYTFGGMYRDSFDVRIARQVAKACLQTHQTLRVDEKFLSVFPSYAEKTVFVTDGLVDVRKSHEIYLNKLARQIAPIRITGKFGSQVMRGVSLLRDRSIDDQLFNQDFKEYIKKAKATFSDISEGNKLSFVLFKEIPWSWAGILAAELSQLTIRSPYLDNELIGLLYQAPGGVLEDSELQLRAISETNPRLLSIRTDMGLGGSSSPFISKVVQLGYQFINNADKLYNWEKMPHWLSRLDCLFSPIHAERLVLGFDQFCHHRIWFQDQLSHYLREMLLDNRTLERPYWNRRFIQKIVYDHTSGRCNYFAEITKILTVELIHRLLLEEI